MTPTCALCGAEHAPDAQFCSACGASLRRVCPACGHEEPAGAAFCSACGARPLRPRECRARCGRGRARGAAGRDPSLRRPRRLDAARGAARPGGRSRLSRASSSTLVTDQVERFGGTTEKFVGDAVLAVFGVPPAHEDDPERARVRAALAVQGRVRLVCGPRQGPARGRGRAPGRRQHRRGRQPGGRRRRAAS